ncbi:MAG TPA: ABC transporter permease [Acidimicrobiales bacterium]|nr:ABC transporter permease [Acidimicrobiales bacterium]
MTFLGLIFHNVVAHKLRALLTAAAVAIGVMAVLALGVLTTSLRSSATEILQVGKADFTIVQKGANPLDSVIAQNDLTAMGKVQGIDGLIGALIETDKYDSSHPAVIEVGLDQSAQKPFGVIILKGRSYAKDSPNEVMLGFALAQSIHKTVGDTLQIGDKTRKVVGLYRTGISFGDSTMMFPLSTLQGENQVPGYVTLGFAKVDPGVAVTTVKRRVAKKYVQYAPIASLSDFGRSNNTLTLVDAANTGGTILAAVIAISGVLNTTLLSFFERIREFGVLRSIGWARPRIVLLVLGEALLVGVVGAAFGLVLGWAAVNVLQNLGSLRGYFKPRWPAGIFARSLYFAVGVALIGALYPAVRAAFISPLAAMRRE